MSIKSFVEIDTDVIGGNVFFGQWSVKLRGFSFVEKPNFQTWKMVFLLSKSGESVPVNLKIIIINFAYCCNIKSGDSIHTLGYTGYELHIKGVYVRTSVVPIPN